MHVEMMAVLWGVLVSVVCWFALIAGGLSLVVWVAGRNKR